MLAVLRSLARAAPVNGRMLADAAGVKLFHITSRGSTGSIRTMERADVRWLVPLLLLLRVAAATAQPRVGIQKQRLPPLAGAPPEFQARVPGRPA